METTDTLPPLQSLSLQERLQLEADIATKNPLDAQSEMENAMDPKKQKVGDSDDDSDDSFDDTEWEDGGGGAAAEAAAKGANPFAPQEPDQDDTVVPLQQPPAPAPAPAPALAGPSALPEEEEEEEEVEEQGQLPAGVTPEQMAQMQRLFEFGDVGLRMSKFAEATITLPFTINDDMGDYKDFRNRVIGDYGDDDPDHADRSKVIGGTAQYQAEKKLWEAERASAVAEGRTFAKKEPRKKDPVLEWGPRPVALMGVPADKSKMILTSSTQETFKPPRKYKHQTVIAFHKYPSFVTMDADWALIKQQLQAHPHVIKQRSQL